MIKAIVTGCGFAESGQIASVLWEAQYECDSASESLNHLKNDLLRSFLDVQLNWGNKETVYSRSQFIQFVLDVCSSTSDSCNLIPNDDEAYFWPFSSMRFLLGCDRSEVLFVDESFELVMAQLVTEEDKAKFDREDGEDHRPYSVVITQFEGSLHAEVQY